MTILRSKRFAIIGVGNIGRVLLERLTLSGVAAEHLIINDSDENRAQHLLRRFGSRVCALTDESLGNVIVFQPPSAKRLLEHAPPWEFQFSGCHLARKRMPHSKSANRTTLPPSTDFALCLR